MHRFSCATKSLVHTGLIVRQTYTNEPLCATKLLVCANLSRNEVTRPSKLVVCFFATLDSAKCISISTLCALGVRILLDFHMTHDRDGNHKAVLFQLVSRTPPPSPAVPNILCIHFDMRSTLLQRRVNTVKCDASINFIPFPVARIIREIAIYSHKRNARTNGN